MGGVCLVIGCHPCWKNDYDTAAMKYPDHKICAVNYAAELVRADYIGTSHASYMEQFLSIQQRIHKNTPILIARIGETTDVNGVSFYEFGSHGGSAVFAASAMVHLGFDLAVMCGCPITGSGGYAQTIYNDNDWHVDITHPRIKKWKSGMAEFKANRPDLSSKIRSMSGNSKEVFGGIDDD